MSEQEFDLFDEEAPASDPAERRAADLRFGLIASLIVGAALLLAIVPAANRRARLQERYRYVVAQQVKVQQELAQTRQNLARFERRDPYYIERLARDRLGLTAPGERAHVIKR